MDFSLYGLLEWVQVNAKNLEAAQSVSNILIVLYAISYIFNRKATFLVAFLLVETYGNASLFSALTDFYYYLGYAFIYSLVYWFVLKKYQMVKTMLGYGILVLFQGAMSLDALYFPLDETYIYTHYASFIVLIHLYIIATLINWRLLRARMGESIDALGCWVGNNYNLSFIWYTLRNSH